MIGLLTNLIPFPNIISFLTNKKRLAIEYALIAIIVATAGFTFNLWLAKGNTEKHLQGAQKELTDVQVRLSTVEIVSKQQEAEIGELRLLRERDAAAFDGLMKDYKALSKNDSLARARLESLEKTDENVHEYLNRAIPSALGCLLSNTCQTGNTGSDKDRASQSPVNTTTILPSPSK